MWQTERVLYLDNVVLSGNALAVIAFGKLHVKSIAYLELNLSGNRNLVTDEFYQIANQLLRDTKVTYCPSISLTFEMAGLDFKQNKKDPLEAC